MKKLFSVTLIIFVLINSFGNNYRYERFSLSLSLKSDFVKAIFVDGENIWVGTHKGLSLINSGKVVSNFYANHKTVVSGNLKMVEGNSFLIDNRINDIEKISDKLYIATDGGLNIFEYISSNWSTIHKENSRLGSNLIKSVAKQNTILWIGTQDKGLYTYNTVSGESKKAGLGIDGHELVTSNRISNINYYEQDDILVVGTFDKGLFIKKGEEWINITTKYPLKSRLPSDRILCTAYGNGELWAGTNKNLVGIRNGKYRLMNEKHGFEYPVILSMLYFEEKLYIGTGRGLYVLDEAEELSRLDLDKKYRIIDIKTTSKNTLMLATQNNGIVEIDIP